MYIYTLLDLPNKQKVHLYVTFIIQISFHPLFSIQYGVYYCSLISLHIYLYNIFEIIKPYTLLKQFI